MFADQWLPALLGLGVLLVLLVVAQFVFKLAWKIFAIGCGGIVLLGLLCVAASFLGGR
ncbi:MAG: hypothetical protein HZB20_04545 [Chloroflexi bacterium]|nr:hypothetical protein [Chloroflexota bacterium]